MDDATRREGMPIALTEVISVQEMKGLVDDAMRADLTTETGSGSHFNQVTDWTRRASSCVSRLAHLAVE